MNRKVIHIVEVLVKLVSIVIFSWMGIRLFKMLMSALGIDISNPENDYNLVELLCIFLVFIPTMLLGVFTGMLCWYFCAARLLKIPRATLELVIKDIQEQAPIEKSKLSKAIYKWCLDKAYETKI